jgi:hypothetical protein
MKGIVLEELKDKLVVLTDEGDFIEIDKLNKKVEIGEEIVIKGQKTNIKKTLKRFAFVAAVFCMVMIGNYTAYASLVTQGYVSISINPSDNKSASVEMAYNSFGKIIKLQALNKEGNALIEKMDRFQFKSTDVIINKFIEASEKDSFISQEKENTIIITIASFNTKIDDESMDSSVEHYIKDNNINAKVMIVTGNKTDYKESKQSGVPIDKLILINKAIEKNSDYKFDDLNKKSIEEITHIINEQEKNY